MTKAVKSERIALRITPELRAQLEEQAELSERTLSDFIARVLERHVEMVARGSK